MRPIHSMVMPFANTVSSTAEQDEVRLVASSKKGDQDAFAQLVQQHQRRVFNLVFRMLQQYDEANEVTQETFRIAYNCALKQLEQRKRDIALQIVVQTEQVVANIGQENRVDAELEAHARQSLVHEQLSQLPAKYRIVLVLRHLQEMTYEEMAEILTMPIGTIKTHLFRARNLLKERLVMFDREQNSRTRG
ncbi:MAG: sigma-70 family RNA polymerase sigma factor [Ktedonobacteraceae bacterium]